MQDKWQQVCLEIAVDQAAVRYKSTTDELQAPPT
jgi:hypothetical protein